MTGDDTLLCRSCRSFIPPEAATAGTYHASNRTVICRECRWGDDA